MTDAIFSGAQEAIGVNDTELEQQMLAHMHRRGKEFRAELTQFLNRYSCENGSDTPDYVLADFVMRALWAFDTATVGRERFNGRSAGGRSIPPQGYVHETPIRPVDAELRGAAEAALKAAESARGSILGIGATDDLDQALREIAQVLERNALLLLRTAAGSVSNEAVRAGINALAVIRWPDWTTNPRGAEAFSILIKETRAVLEAAAKVAR